MAPPTSGVHAEPLQGIVDRLAAVLGRSVAIDDAALRLLAHSAHVGDEDPARVDSLVRRSVTPERAAWSRRVGVLSATEPFLTPSADELGVRSRWVAPVRVDRELVAIVWIIDDGTLTADERAAIDRSVDDVREVLLQRRSSAEVEAQRTRGLVRELVSEHVGDRARAAAQLADSGVFRGCTAYTVLRVRDIDADHTGSIPLRAAERTLTRQTFAFAASFEQDAMTIVAGSHAALSPTRLREAAESTLEAIDEATGRPGRAVVGLGSPAPTLLDVGVSATRADLAVRVARARGERVASWDGIGLDGMLAALLPPAVSAAVLPPPLVEVIASQPAETLVAVRSFLDNAGNVVRTGEALRLHRTTVYYRLSRFSETSGLDLDDGATRLMLQLWFALGPYTVIE